MIATHPDTGRVLDADAASFAPLGLTEAEADAVSREAGYLEDHNGGPLSMWVASVLDDIRRGIRDRRGMVKW